MGNVTLATCWKSLYAVLLVALTCIGVTGAETVQITWLGGVRAGFTTTFTCSSTCFPNCAYTWAFKARTVNGTTLTLTPDGLDDTVALRCTVFNPKTRDRISTTAIVEIESQLTVQISPPDTIPSLNQSLDLICHGASSDDPQGPSDLVWYKDGQKVTLHEKMWLLQNNLTLHFDSLLPSDAGFYQCQTYLPTSHTRVVSLSYLLSYDPWNVSISGPDTVFPGQLYQFTCLASCTLSVECTVRWQFRGGFPIGTFFSVHENELRWTPSVPGKFQNFTCIAENKATRRTAETTKMVEVKGVPIAGSEVVQLSGLVAVMLILRLWIL